MSEGVSEGVNTYITYTTEGTWRNKPRSLPTYLLLTLVPSRPVTPTLFALDRIASHRIASITTLYTTQHYHCCLQRSG